MRRVSPAAEPAENLPVWICVISREAHMVYDPVKDAAHSAQTTTDQVKDSLKDTAEHYGQTAKQCGKSMTDQAKCARDAAATQANEATAAVSDQIKAHPLLSVGIAAAVGYALSWLGPRHSSRRG
jgi:ElaB/YqjD/DUF883 family membrane-anchored ribosome-binding protein